MISSVSKGMAHFSVSSVFRVLLNFVTVFSLLSSNVAAVQARDSRPVNESAQAGLVKQVKYNPPKFTHPESVKAPYLNEEDSLNRHIALSPSQSGSFDVLSCPSQWPGVVCQIITPGKHLRLTYNGTFNNYYYAYVKPSNVNLPVSWRAVISHSETYYCRGCPKNKITDYLRFSAIGGSTYFDQVIATTPVAFVASYSNLVVEWQGQAQTKLPDYRFEWKLSKAADWPSTDTLDIVIDFYYGYLPKEIQDQAVDFGGNFKLSGTGELDGNISTTGCGDTQGECGDPINTRTGGFSFGNVDLSIPTSAGELVFQRQYSSSAVDSHTSPMGYGWAGNQIPKLIFPSSPGGQPGYIIFQGVSGNRHRFEYKPNGVFEPDPGVTASLTLASNVYTVTGSDQSKFIFNSQGRLTQRLDPQGQAFDYIYDTHGRLTRVNADNAQRYIAIAYDASGRINQASDHAGRQVAYGYDAAGDLVTVTDVLNQTWTYAYDTAHRMTQMTDPDGKTIALTEYDAQGRAWRQYDGENNLITQVTYNPDGGAAIFNALNNTTTHEYNDQKALSNTTDPLLGETAKSYDVNFRPVSITDPAGDITTLTWSADGANLTRLVDAEGGQTDITYNSLNLPTSVVDPRDFLTTYAYTGVNLTGMTNALNQTTTYTYTPEGYLESVTDPLNHTTSYTYDSHGQRISMTDALNNTWSYTYDSLGRLTDTTDPLGHVTHNVYDAAGRLTGTTVNYDPNKVQNEDNEWNIVTTYAYDVQGNQISVTDTLGRTTQYEFDNAGRLTKTIDPAGNETTNTYNAAGQLVSTTDALGRTTQYAYDAAGRLVSTTDALGHVTSTAYNPDGTVASTTDALGRVTSYEYDSLKRVITVTQPNGGETHNTYDDAGNLATTTDALGNVTTYEYDALNRLIKTTDALGNFTETFYDAAGRVIQAKDARGNATTYAYDNAGRQTSVTDALGNVTTYEYDSLGRRTSVTDANGNETTYTYDELSRTVEITDALGHSSTVTYDALGQTLARADANGNSTSFAYNNLGQLAAQTDALNNSVSFTYDDAGNRLTFTDANGHTTTTTYDALNRAVAFTDANNNAASSTYDAAGNLSVSSDALGNDTTYSYNALNQPNVITDPLGNETANLYNARGDLVLTTDAEGIVTKYEYDELGRLTAVVENYQAGIPADSETNVHTEYTYDQNGDRLTILDANGHLTTFTYDVLNRLLTETDALNHTWTYGYDNVGNRISMTDPNGGTTNYVYDDANRLVTIDYPGTSIDVTFTYDDGGRRLTMTDGLGTTTWTYNALNQVTAVTDPFNKTVEYDYDDAGNKTEITYPDDTIVSYTYDDANRLTLVNGFSTAVQYTYDNANRLTLISRPNPLSGTGSINTAYSYDDAGRLLSITHAQGIELLSSFGYNYDNVGNRVQAVEDVKSPQLPPVPTNTPTLTPFPTQADTSTPTITLTPSETTIPTETLTPTETLIPTNTATPTETLEFPPTETMTLTPSDTPEFTFTPSETSTPTETLIPTDTATTTETQTPTETMTPSETFTPTDTFTPTLTWTPTVTNTPLPQSGPVTINYVYDSLYRLAEANYSTGQFYYYTYNTVGNRLTETTHVESNTYAYDNANRLASVNSVNYTFDANGNLLNDGVNSYTYDSANQLISDGTITYTYNGLGDRYQQTVGSQTTTYILDLNAGLTQVLDDGDNSYLYGVGRISQVNAGHEYFMGDALGSVRQLTDASGAVTLAKAYTPYGETLSTAGSGVSAFAYTGEQVDPNGLVFLRARYYNASIGRFQSRDIWNGNVNSPLSLNRWNYTHSNPVNYTDPSGKCIFTGVDTVACLIALVIGIPIVAGVTTGAYDLAVTQGTGVGGHNAGNFACADFSQVLLATEGGTLGALNSEGEMLSSLILFPTYIMAYLVYGETPAEVNMNILSGFGLDDEYQAAMNDPNFVAGKYGGQAATTYISLASFFKGLPTSVRPNSTSLYRPIIQNNGTLAYTVLTLPGIEVVGGSGQLVYIGAAGFSSQFAAIDGSGGGGGGYNSGAYNNYINKPSKDIRKAIRSYEKQVQIHKNKIADPSKFVRNWDQLPPERQQYYIQGWQDDIKRNQDLADLMRSILRERGEIP